MKGDSEPSVLALQEAVKNASQSDTILENSTKGESQSNGAAENAVREAEMEGVRSRHTEYHNWQQAYVATVAWVTCGRDHHTVQESPRCQDGVPKDKEQESQ